MLTCSDSSRFRFSLYIFILVVFTSASALITDPIINGTELVFAFMVHRHGDRTPVTDSLDLVKTNIDKNKIDELIKPWGFGQLTDRGMRTGYKTGQFIRWRYDDIIAKRYNESEIFIRCTDLTRAKMTALTAMSAVFSAADNPWSGYINWTPVPYTTVPEEYDFNICPKYIEKFYNYSSPRGNNSRMNPYKDFMKKVSALIGNDITKIPMRISDLYDFFVSLLSMGYKLGKDFLKLMPQIRKATETVWEINFGNQEYRSLQSGVLLNEFFKYSKVMIAGNHTQKVRIYSAHDINVYGLKAISRVTPIGGVPKYGSLFSLELRRVKGCGKYVVLPVYLADPSEGPAEYLQIRGCGGFLCNFDTFYSITSADIVNEDQWWERCRSSKHVKFDK